MGNKIQRIYIGTDQVRPIKKIECDFTQGDQGFTFAGRTGSCNYGRNSSGLYVSYGSGQYYGVAWAIPSSIYSLGRLKQVKLQLFATTDLCGGGVSKGVDTMVSRTWNGNLESGWGTYSEISLGVNNPANTVYYYTVDLANKKLYTSISSVEMTLTDADVTTILSNRTGGTFNICAMLNRRSGTQYSYIQKATFEIYG